MPIRTIEIMCLPCSKCEQLKSKIKIAIKAMELQKAIRITYEFKHTPHLKELIKYSLNASQTPAVIINGNVELAGRIEPTVLKAKLEQIFRGI